jgi:uncharacterized protein YecT (DUF1311 family)
MQVRLRESGLSGVIAGALMGLPLPVLAEGEAEAIRACLADAARPMDCIGLTVRDCTALPGGETTVGMVACITTETDVWDAILNEEYQTTLARLRAADATGDLAAADLTREGTLREAQRAWIAFRDAECRAQYALWGGGTIRQIVGANCVMAETAERAIELRQMREP